MKKKCNYSSFKGRIGKTLMIMRLLMFLMLVGVMQLSASVYSQNSTFTLKMENGNLEKVMNHIKSTSEYYFLYKNSDIASVSNLDLNLLNVTVQEVLKTCLKGTNLDFSIKNNIIIIRKFEKIPQKVVAEQKKITIKGVVKDSKGTPLPGVSVVVKGTNTGTATDVEGKFEILLDKRGVELEISFIGMAPQQIKIDKRNFYSIVLKENQEQLDEVMVVAYGVTKKESFTGSASVVKSKAIEKVPVASFEKALTGMISGLTTSNTSGQPGASTSIHIRGMGSFSASNQPLYVVDGIVSTSDVLSTLNPGDIASITVLKDAAAASLYGSRAANGVIVVSTKKGKSGETRFNLRSYMGFSDFATDNFENVNGEEFLMLLNESMVNAGMDEEEIQEEIEDNNWVKPKNGFTNWRDELFRTGVTKNIELSASGGNEKTTFYISGNYYKETGVAEYSDIKRLSGRIKLDHKVSEKLKLGVNSLIAQTVRNNQSGGSAYSNPFYFANRKAWPTESPYDEDGNLVPVLHGNTYNIVKEYDLNKKETTIFRNNTSGWIEYSLLDGLIAKTTLSLDWINNEYSTYTSPLARSGRELKGGVSIDNSKYTKIVSSTTLNYLKSLGDHNFNVLVGYEVEDKKAESYYAKGKTLPNPILDVLSVCALPDDISGSNSSKSMISYFSRINYDFNYKYYASASFRRDGSSKLGLNQRWANFWSVSGSWRLTKEDFMKSFEFLNDLKVKVSYGTSGNLPTSYFGYMALYSYSGSYNSLPAGSDYQYENNDLTWEKNNTLNVGLDFKIFNKISGTFEYFNRQTKDLLIEVPLSRITGFSSTWLNYGEMSNKGFEIELKSDNIVNDNFKWFSTLNITHEKNAIEKLYKGEPISSSTSIKKEGCPYYTFYLKPWAGVDPENGDPLWYKIDEEGKYIINEETGLKETTNDYGETSQIEFGNPYPDFYGGLNNTFSYKGIDLSFLFNFSFGGQLYYSSGYKLWRDGASATSYAIQRDQLDRWQNPGDNAKHPKRIWDRDDKSAESSSRFLMDNDYIRLKNLTLAYNLPKTFVEKINVNSLRLYVQTSNIFTWSSQDLCDPEQGTSGRTDFEIPNQKTVSFGVELSF